MCLCRLAYAYAFLIILTKGLISFPTESLKSFDQTVTESVSRLSGLPISGLQVVDPFRPPGDRVGLAPVRAHPLRRRVQGRRSASVELRQG